MGGFYAHKIVNAAAMADKSVFVIIATVILIPVCLRGERGFWRDYLGYLQAFAVSILTNVAFVCFWYGLEASDRQGGAFVGTAWLLLSLVLPGAPSLFRTLGLKTVSSWLLFVFYGWLSFFASRVIVYWIGKWFFA